MNKQTRKELAVLGDTLSLIMEDLQVIIDAEQERYDNTPESFVNSARAEAMASTIDRMTEAYTTMEDVLEILQNPDEI